DAKDRRSLTESVPLLGAQGVGALRRGQSGIAEKYGWDEDRVKRLIRRYGTLIEDLLDLVDEDPELGQPLEGAERYLRVEAHYAAAAEGAVHLGDILERRMRLNYESPDRGKSAADAVAAIVASVLGWDAERQSAEVEDFNAHVDAQVAAESTDDDASAAALVGETLH
ncbi:glycerol-3-phosphate dehydrogenase C-terminal domain-containing protein, partial [Brevibacterium epidermidis]